MSSDNKKKHVFEAPALDLFDGTEMLVGFSREGQRHLISARNSLLVLESVPTDKESIENIFKTFHTIRGLADFLELEDICYLTNTAQSMLDMARKDQLAFAGDVAVLTTQAVGDLQKLLELLDDQIANDGKSDKPYLDTSELIHNIENVISLKPVSLTIAKKMDQVIPALISIEPRASLYTKLNEKVKGEEAAVSIDAQELKAFLDDFNNIQNRLMETQSKLQERQRELIKERELAIKLTQQAQNEARAKSEYLANMSHEIRTLINAILGFTAVLLEGRVSDKQKAHLDTIILSGKMLLEIVNNILDFSKVESGKLKLEHIEFNFEHIISEVFRIIRTRLNAKPINLYFEIEEGVPLNYLGDPTRLKQVFINLIDNAIKFTEEGEIGMTVAFDKEAEDSYGEGVLRFVVQDTGIGIPEDKKNHVFESFSQASDSTTRMYGGTGLGLALCKNFIEKMGGKIWIESEMGNGTQFIFNLNLEKSKTEDQEEAVVTFDGNEVMIIEGHQKTVDKLRALCKKMHLTILNISNSAKQASEYLGELTKKNQTLPKVVFIDTMLPNKEGFMLAYKIKQREQYKTINLVSVSSDVKLEMSSESEDAGFDLSLVKPIICDEFAEVMQRLIGELPAERRVITASMLDKISCEGLHVLVVEDSLPNQELLKVHFESLGCICDYASNGQEALECLEGNMYDICFMDLQMPLMGGLQAAKAIRQELGLTLPIVALTAAEIQEEKEKCFESGMNDYLSKPFGLNELKAKIVQCTNM
ncbi:MAG: response regulator [Candidatus Omnitrophica bacterium]|nr:response regulator [Candidatus Omnitrophota bacterium]